MSTIVYGNTVKYKGSIGIVKEIKGSIAKVLFNGNKKPITISITALEKIDE